MAKKECVALILAGGQGKRLNVLTKHLAKPAIPFGGRYRIIDFTLSNCYNSLIDTVGVLTQYQPLMLHSHLTGGCAELAGAGGGVFILPPYQRENGGEWYKGTSNAVYQNLEFVERYDPDCLLVLSGDQIYKMDYRLLLEYHRQKQAELTIATLEVPWQDAGRFGIISVTEEGGIADFVEKPAMPQSNLASMGIYVFHWPFVRKYLQADEADVLSSHDFGKDVIPRMLKSGCRAYAYRFSGYWRDVGTVESLWQANMDLLREDAPLELNDPNWMIHTSDPVQPPHFVNDAAVTRQALISEGCMVYGQVERSVLFPGVVLGKGAVVKNSVIMPNVVIGDNVHVDSDIIGSDTVIEANSEIAADETDAVKVVGQGLCISAAGIETSQIGTAGGGPV